MLCNRRRLSLKNRPLNLHFKKSAKTINIAFHYIHCVILNSSKEPPDRVHSFVTLKPGR